ncbi:GH1 family beta-glucosidase [Microbacterium kyungheense]|uniref:Beta-glucosidase n=1 Tax=Microbacterium kyungheense TaxID=1263636 RepID=A0A543F2Y7_9MICO|nr:GH1 family beta-glucosidase [Microbacterium kyungheense]TQM28150.1 beta-glucosidase [Microbacterium kyungheense]
MPTPLRRDGDLSRRTFLLATGGITLTAALAACAPGSPSTSPTGTPTPSAWMPPTEPMAFPKGYTWGAATSSFQIEGALTADGRGPSVWDTFAALPGKIADRSTGDPAADQYHRYADDVALMSSLGLGAYRFSISWSRVLPTGAGDVNQAGLDYYRRLVDALVGAGIRPAITLFHWDLPQALQDAGGWATRDTAARFADYAAICFDALGDSEADWLTVNEPKTHAFVGHWYGTHAPGLRKADAAAAAVHHQLLAHGLAVQRFRDSGAPGRIGAALNLIPVIATEPDYPEAATFTDARENRLFLDPVLKGSYPDDAIGDRPGQLPADPAAFAALQQPGDLEVISAPCDLLAIQYYGVTGVDGIGNTVEVAPTSLASWQQIDPQGLYDLLVRLKDEYPAIPLIITENGIPDPTGDLTVDDPDRIEFLRAHLQQAARAIGDGVPLEGHYVWSLLDNFEWAEGYTQRWGIVAVDFETQERTPKKSAGFFSDVIAANAVARD